MKLSLGFSPCPNDTFIFDALVHDKIDTEGLSFEVILADVEELNRLAFAGELDITKLSYHAFAHLADQYVLLDAGSALGNNCGPLLIARKPIALEEVPGLRVAIPGKYTTANFLLGLAFPDLTQKTEYLFSEIERAVLEGEVDAGLIIHENRFTYAEKGLHKVIDLGEFWESTTQMPIPLGGIVTRRALPESIQAKVNRVLARSVAFALDHPKESLPYVRDHAQEMDEEVMYQHIHLYVNDFTRDLGPQGRAAVSHLFETAWQKNLIPPARESIFLS
ncbi:MAG: 1,4-dihydroxy-6-naphthoate synthase [Lewinellaceae bacterium]|nr:1,4-dihydroxy-6-naphthoate synthase [Lewinellaceae bacterium]